MDVLRDTNLLFQVKIAATSLLNCTVAAGNIQALNRE